MSEKETGGAAVEAFLTQWRQWGVQARTAFEKEDFGRNALKSFEESRAALQSAMEPIVNAREGLQEYFNQMEARRQALLDMAALDEQARAFRISIEKSVHQTLRGLHQSFEQLSPKIQDAVLLLGAHGWYFDVEMSLPSLLKLKSFLEVGDVVAVEGVLAQHFEECLNKIEALVIRKFPARKKLMQSAFSAHRRGEYELSIPVFLAQVDGMCKESVNEYLFIKKNNKPRTAIYVEQIQSDSFLAAILSPLANSLPIGLSEKDRGADFCELNRHAVLHGDSLDYGTKVNGLKAVSLVNYVAQVLRGDELGVPAE